MYGGVEIYLHVLKLDSVGEQSASYPVNLFPGKRELSQDKVT
jgi:hypothetical protein